MVADFPYAQIDISGIVGSIPVCTKLVLNRISYHTLEPTSSLISEVKISNNNPNVKIVKSGGYNSGDKFEVILYDENGNELARNAIYPS